MATYVDPCAGCELMRDSCLLNQGQCHFKQWAERKEVERLAKAKREQKPEINYDAVETD